MKKSHIFTAILVLACILIWPLVGSEYQVYLTLSFFAYSVALLGLNLLFNYTGLLSFGHALFVGLGGYTAAFLSSRFHILSMEISILIAVLISGIVAAVIGLICVRYIRIYFAMLTLAFGMLFHSFLMKSYYLTGGDEGMAVEQLHLLGVDFGSMDQMRFFCGPYYYYSLAVLILAVIVMWRIVHSPFGLCLMAIRDNPEKAEYLGIEIRKYRWIAFVISGCFGGVGGVLLAPVIGHMDPGMVFWTHSGDMVFMTLVGGFSSFFGPMLGSVIFIYLQDIISSFMEYWRFVFGALLAIIVIFAPEGVMSLLSGLFSSLISRIKGGEEPSDS